METIIGNNINSITAVAEFINKDQEVNSIDQEVGTHSIQRKYENAQEGINICHLFMLNNFKQLDF
ncbi:MAG: hypothetical protein NTZ33_06825 [Bacteroidetes bacterium]|nr:hypothetical protein [Bacteroidota bacterium]